MKTKKMKTKNLKETGLCLMWDGHGTDVVYFVPAGFCKDADGNTTVQYLPVETMAREIRRYVGGYLDESNTGLSGSLYIDQGRWEGFPWLYRVGTYRVDVFCTEFLPHQPAGCQTT